MWSDNETTKDFLGFRINAQFLKTLVINKELLPLTIGLFGDWGSGKTSVMKMLSEELEKENGSNIACLYLNGWLFEGYDDAKSALISSILMQLSEHEKYGPKIQEKVGSLLKSVNWMRLAGMGFKNVALPVIAAYLSGGATAIPSILKLGKGMLGIKAGDSENTSSDGINYEELINSDESDSSPTDIRTFRERFSEMLKNSDIDILVVLIDDLDRCSPDRIIENLEAIKLFLSVENTSFVIGADRRIVKQAIRIRYEEKNIEKESKEDRLIEDYLEKLVQIPYHLPRLSPSEIESYMTLLFCEKDLDEDTFSSIYEKFCEQKEQDKYKVFNYETCKSILSSIPSELEKSLLFITKTSALITEGLMGNPRQVKRFLNAFLLRKKLVEVAKIPEFKEEILVKLMVLEYVKEKCFRDLFKKQASQDGKPSEIIEYENCINEEKDIADSLWNSYFAKKWLKMEPQLSNIDLRDYFWIARDRLENTMSDVEFIPLIVQRVLKDITSGSAAAMKKAKDSMPELDSTEIQLLIRNIYKKTINEPDIKANFQAIGELIRLNISGAVELLKDALQESSPEKLNPAIANDLKQLIRDIPTLETEIMPIIDSLIDEEARISVALKQSFKGGK